MNSLKIPDNGLLLAGLSSDLALPPQAFHIQLDKSTIDAIIKASRNGEDLSLSLGQSPVRFLEPVLPVSFMHLQWYVDLHMLTTA